MFWTVVWICSLTWSWAVLALPFGASVYLPMESLVSGQVLGGSYTGTVSGTGVSLVPGVLGKAVHIGSDSSYVDLGEIRDRCFGHPDLCTDGYTLAFWINRAYTDGVGYYISNGGQTYASFGITCLSKSGGLVHFALKTTTQWFKLNIPLAMGSWHHVVMTWHPAQMLQVYVDGALAGSSDVTANERTTSNFNNFYLGIPNNAVTKFGDLYIDEILSWDSVKDAIFIQDLFEFYNNILALQFHAQNLFLILADSMYNEMSGVEPIMQCVPRVHIANTPHPCRLECMWLPWCGSVVYDGRMCKYYNVYFPQPILSVSNNSSMFIKQ